MTNRPGDQLRITISTPCQRPNLAQCDLADYLHELTENLDTVLNNVSFAYPDRIVEHVETTSVGSKRDRCTNMFRDLPSPARQERVGCYRSDFK